ncbi:hypothetical protein WT97_19800 [Burkholderia sp. MSMB1459WGS]|nr:hypothetical protein WT97_19800 [Burkholderia sp. MSMB1459WGS]
MKNWQQVVDYECAADTLCTPVEQLGLATGQDTTGQIETKKDISIRYANVFIFFCDFGPGK